MMIVKKENRKPDLYKMFLGVTQSLLVIGIGWLIVTGVNDHRIIQTDHEAVVQLKLDVVKNKTDQSVIDTKQDEILLNHSYILDKLPLTYIKRKN